jgi:hypothetical protein
MARKRRGRGEGSISARCDGLWEAKLSLGYGHDGKRVRRTVYARSKGEVQQKLRDLQIAMVGGVDAQAERITVGEWLTRWLALVEPTIEPNTYGPYERHVRLHIAPILGAIRLAKLKRGDVVNFLSAGAQNRPPMGASKPATLRSCRFGQ